MKKVIYLLIACTIAFIGCTPLDDVYSELDNKNPITTDVIGDGKYTLTKDDYKTLKLENNYFMTEAQAKELLPAFLKGKYNFWTKGSSALITYDLSNMVSTKSYTLTKSDYEAIKLKALTSESEYRKFLDYKYPNARKGDQVELTYLTNPDITRYTLTKSDYTLVGNGKYNNFDIRKGKSEETEEARRAKINTILLKKFPDAKLGDIYKVDYATYDGKAGTMSMTVVLEENKIDNVKQYGLTKADYTLVGNGKYNNFDIRKGKSEETEEARRAKINTILLKKFPNSKDGDVYSVTYKAYSGSLGAMQMKLVLRNSVWQILKPFSYKSYVFEYVKATSIFVNSGNWEMPFKLTSEEYRTLGQKYDNFSGRNEKQKAEAYKIISKYLGNKFTYESKGSYKTVMVNFYEGGGKTTTATPTFIFDGTVWNLMQKSVPTTLQFGFDGKTWVPDNTIKYTLTGADFELVGNGKYKNFDVRAGKDEETIEARVAKINTILLKKFPNAEEGQKYLVTYAVYNGSAGIMSTKVIKKGNNYIEFKEK